MACHSSSSSPLYPAPPPAGRAHSLRPLHLHHLPRSVCCGPSFLDTPLASPLAPPAFRSPPSCFTMISSLFARTWEFLCQDADASLLSPSEDGAGGRSTVAPATRRQPLFLISTLHPTLDTASVNMRLPQMPGAPSEGFRKPPLCQQAITLFSLLSFLFHSRAPTYSRSLKPVAEPPFHRMCSPRCDFRGP